MLSKKWVKKLRLFFFSPSEVIFPRLHTYYHDDRDEHLRQESEKRCKCSLTATLHKAKIQKVIIILIREGKRRISISSFLFHFWDC